MLIIRPKTLVRWHRAGLRRYWRWKSRSAGGRPQVDAELRALIWRMSVDNRLWGAPHIHGELLKLNPLISELLVTRRLLLRPVELSSVDPYAVQNYRELARDGNSALSLLVV